MAKIVTARCLVALNGKILCARLKPYKAESPDSITDYWCLPGGRVENHESIADAAKREMLEETGILPQLGQLLYVQQFIQDQNEFVEFIFYATNPTDYLNIDLSKTSHGQQEIAEIAFKDPQAVFILPKFLSQEPLPNAGAINQTKIFSYLEPKNR